MMKRENKIITREYWKICHDIVINSCKFTCAIYDFLMFDEDYKYIIEFKND